MFLINPMTPRETVAMATAIVTMASVSQDLRGGHGYASQRGDHR